MYEESLSACLASLVDTWQLAHAIDIAARWEQYSKLISPIHPGLSTYRYKEAGTTALLSPSLTTRISKIRMGVSDPLSLVSTAGLPCFLGQRRFDSRPQ